ASVASAEGSNGSLRQATSTWAGSQGPRARTPAATPTLHKVPSALVERRRKHWGWGYEDEQPSPEELNGAAAFLTDRLGFGSPDPEQPVALSDVSLPAARLRAPSSLASICATDDYTRALHCYGRSYRDIVRAFRGRFEHPPDVVAHPRDERELQATLDWALSAGAAVIPFGGGTSVVGGVEAAGCGSYAGVVTIDLKALDRVLEVDPVSLSARIQAGAT